jgi:hypothetical protein
MPSFLPLTPSPPRGLKSQPLARSDCPSELAAPTTFKNQPLASLSQVGVAGDYQSKTRVRILKTVDGGLAGELLIAFAGCSRGLCSNRRSAG